MKPLTRAQLRAFQQKMDSEGRNWRLVLLCAEEAGCPDFERLQDFAKATRQPLYTDRGMRRCGL